MERSVLVTGANSGIGLATALLLARAGFRVVGSVRSDAKAEVVAKAAADSGVHVETVVLDLDDRNAGERVVPELKLWGLVNNAGYPNFGAVEDVPAADARRQLEVMVVAPVRLAQLALPAMRARGEGRIVNVASVSARTTGPLIGWYQAAKHALAAVTDALRMETAGHGIDVTLVSPGSFRTAIWSKAEQDLLTRRRSSPYPEAYERAMRILRTVEPHMPSPDAVAETVCRALRAGQPKDRYRIGADAVAFETAEKLLPSQFKDRALRRVLGL